MSSRRRRIHRSRRSNKPILIAGSVVVVAAIAIVVVYIMSTAEYTLTVHIVGQGSVVPGNSTYSPGTSVELEAVSASDWTFYGWGGDVSGSDNTSVVLNSNKVATAWFIPNNNKVLLTTSMGNITIQLRDNMPITTGNFKSLVQQGKYDGTAFHRIIAGFMIQGGQINSAWPNIQDEFSNDNRNLNGTVAMAKTSEANSATSQFFINVADNSNLDEDFDLTYSVFGDVIDGMDVAMAISEVATDENDSPLQTVTLIKAEFIE